MTATAQETTQTKAVTKKKTAAVAVKGSWGKTSVDTDDILVHRIIPVQAMSKAVTSGEASVGDLVTFPGNTVIGGTEKPVQFVPFKSYKTWNVFVGETKPKWVREEAFGPANAMAEQKWTEGGQTYVRNKTLNFMCLLLGDTFFPVIIPFSKSSFRVGQELTNHFLQMEDMNLPPAHNIWSMKTKKVTFDDNTWFAPCLTKGEVTPDETLINAKKWYDMLTPENIRTTQEETPTVTDVDTDAQF